MRRLGAACVAVVLAAAAGAAGPTGDTLVTIGSNPAPFSQNKQNEPAVAVDQAHPATVVAGSNDNIDMEQCNAGDPTTCPFTGGVGVSGVYFSFNGGQSWTQPTYSGWSARDCTGPAACQPHVGPIGTLPNYLAAGLVSDGDPTVAFGPQPNGSGGFSYANGSRLYFGNLTSNFSAVRSETAFNGFEDIAVSHTDNVAAAAAGSSSAWSAPALVGKQNSALFNDKINVWADNTASSTLLRQRVCLQHLVPRTGERQRCTGSDSRLRVDRRRDDVGRPGAGQLRDQQQPDRRSPGLHGAHRQPRNRLRVLGRIRRQHRRGRDLPGPFVRRWPALREGAARSRRSRRAGSSIRRTGR